MSVGTRMKKTADGEISAGRGRNARRLTVTMGPSFQRIRIRAAMLSDKESGVGVKGTATRSGAQDDGQERAEETAATVTGTS